MSEEIKKPSIDSQDEIDVIALFNEVKKSRNLIIYIVSFFALASIMYSLILPKIWISESLLSSIEGSGKSSNAGMSSLGGLASMAGVSMQSSGKASKADIAIATLESRDFLKHLLTFDGVLENLTAFSSFDSEKSISNFDSSKYNAELNKWIVNPPSYLKAFKEYSLSTSVRVSKNSGLIAISVYHGSPVFAKTFLDLIIRELNSLMRERDLIESEAKLDYLYSQLGTSQMVDVNVAIGQLIEGQLKTQMLAKVRKNYSLQPIDSPYQPEERSSPVRTRIVFMGILLGFFVALLVIISRYYFIRKS